jgi:hypothetical protein
MFTVALIQKWVLLFGNSCADQAVCTPSLSAASRVTGFFAFCDGPGIAAERRDGDRPQIIMPHHYHGSGDLAAPHFL